MKKIKPSFEVRIDRLINESSPFNVVEAYRSIRTNISFSLSGKDRAKKLVVASSIPSEGKSTTVANLAVSFANNGNRVLLIDCDLRKPRMNKFFEVKNSVGLSSYLSGQVESESILTKTAVPNLSLIVAGIVPPNPTELLASAKMNDLLIRYENEFDYIFIDSTPLCSVADTMILVPIVDGIILVAKEKYTPYPDLEDTIKKLEFANAKILGIILNDSDGKRKEYNKYNYDYKYQYMKKK